MELLRLSKAAQRLGIHPMTLRRWAINNFGSLVATFSGWLYGMRSAQARERLLAETARSVEDRAE